MYINYVLDLGYVVFCVNKHTHTHINYTHFFFFFLFFLALSSDKYAVYQCSVFKICEFAVTTIVLSY